MREKKIKRNTKKTGQEIVLPGNTKITYSNKIANGACELPLHL